MAVTGLEGMGDNDKLIVIACRGHIWPWNTAVKLVVIIHITPSLE